MTDAKAEDVMDTGRLFDPGHQLVTTEAGVAANDDFHFVAKAFADGYA
jgi:hypothetical protein